MAIGAYTGLPRSGKTYQVVCVLILSALRLGRRVVTNVTCYPEVIREFLIAEGVDPAKIGEIVFVTREQVLSEFFFANVEDQEAGIQTILQPGDLLVLDEIWDIWPERGMIPERHMRFFRKHGHMSHPVTGFTFEVALITQDVKDINEHIKRVVDETYRCKKDTEVGSDSTYVVEVFARGSEFKKDFLRSFKGFYNKRYFGMYKSHSGAIDGAAKPKEQKIDTRGNVLKGPLFRFVIPLFLFFSMFAVNKVWSFFHKEPAPAPAAANAPGTPGFPAVDPRPQAAAASNWRAVGWFSPGKDRVVIVERDGAYRQVFPPTGWSLQRTQYSGKVDDSNVATWTGARPSGNSVLGVSK